MDSHNPLIVCGIAGIIVTEQSRLTDLERPLRDMANAMRHRGPDDEGIFVSASGLVGLANRRLAIRDLSPAGHMPMESADGQVVITYNGEIYNADELRAELLRAGRQFRSTSDTEVILEGYAEWGEQIVQRLRGMFAFAIADFRKNEKPTILIARDHLGIKPVYTYQSSNIFAFASELKALLASDIMPRSINPAGLAGYLMAGSVPNPLTIYRDVRALEPSTYLMMDTGTSLAPHSTTYWSLPVETSPAISQEAAAERCHELLREAVRMRLVSDVPLGAFLSGGLDSSSVVALMRECTSGTIRTCSMVFEEAEYSEAHFARAVAQAVGAEHFERTVTSHDLEREFDHILHSLDQPSVDGVNTYFVSQTAKQAGLTVALSGLGGDELFGGYPNTFRDVPRVQQALSWTARVPGGSAVVRQAVKARSDRARWGRIVDALDRPPTFASAYLTRRGLFSPSEAQQLVGQEQWQEAIRELDLHSSVAARAGGNGHADAFAWVSRAELRCYTHDQLLRDTDVMSMAHSLEVRVPMLDRELVSEMLRLQAGLKRSVDGRPKPLLADAMRGLLPDTVLDRRDKQGFTFPFAVWLRARLSGRTKEAISAAVGAGMIDEAAAFRLFDQFQQGKIHWSRAWALAALASAA